MTKQQHHRLFSFVSILVTTIIFLVLLPCSSNAFGSVSDVTSLDESNVIQQVNARRRRRNRHQRKQLQEQQYYRRLDDEPAPLPFRFDAGSTSFNWIDPVTNYTWYPDTYSTGGRLFTPKGCGTTWTIGQTRGQWTNIYCTSRVFDDGTGYSIPVPAGKYKVILHFVEHIEPQKIGKRVFSIKVQDTMLISNFDIYGTVGSRNAFVIETPNPVIVRQSLVSQYVNQVGYLNIQFFAQVGNPLVNAVQIIPLYTPTSAPVSKEPVSKAPVTKAPVTKAPVTTAPVTTAPITKAPATKAPSTIVPVTEIPITKTPVSIVGGTAVPVTAVPLFAIKGTVAPATVTAPATKTPQVGTTPATTKQPSPVVLPPILTTTAPVVVKPFDLPAIRINSGAAEDWVDPFTGYTWLADKYYDGGATFNICPKATATTPFPAQPLTNVTCSHRWFLGKPAQYVIPVPANETKNYRLNIIFDEIYHTEIGKRVFDVVVQGTTVVKDLDIVKEVGPDKPFTYTQDIVVPIDSNTITVGVLNRTDSALISGIEILPLTTTGTVPVPAPASVPTPIAPAFVGGITLEPTVSSQPTISEPPVGATNGATLRINCGSDSEWFDPITAYQWVVDTPYTTDGAPFNGCTDQDKIGGGTEERFVLCSFRWFGEKVASYTIPVPPANYKIKLLFEEIYHLEAGKRSFNATVNGFQVAQALDVVKMVGPKQPYAINAELDLSGKSSTESKIVIELEKIADTAMISGIEIVPLK